MTEAEAVALAVLDSTSAVTTLVTGSYAELFRNNLLSVAEDSGFLTVLIVVALVEWMRVAVMVSVFLEAEVTVEAAEVTVVTLTEVAPDSVTVALLVAVSERVLVTGVVPVAVAVTVLVGREPVPVYSNWEE